MKRYSKNNFLETLPLYRCRAFSLIETATALIILSLVCSSVLVVVNRCMASTADSTLHMQAFEVARENMEILLAADSVTEMADYGTSDKYPGVQWDTVSEMFYEPLTERMWLQAVCSAEYTDTQGEIQRIELTHWLTDLTKEQMLEMLELQFGDLAAEDIIETIEEAADYAGVTEETIDLWLENGMLVTDEEYYIKNELDLYKKTGGKPTDKDRVEFSNKKGDTEKSVEPKVPVEPEGPEPVEPEEPEPVEPVEPVDPTGHEEPEPDLIFGEYTPEQLRQLPVSELFRILSQYE